MVWNQVGEQAICQIQWRLQTSIKLVCLNNEGRKDQSQAWKAKITWIWTNKLQGKGNNRNYQHTV
jgi:hypothetical protein